MPLTTKQCIDQIKIYADELQRDGRDYKPALAIAEFLERHHQDMFNESIKGNLPSEKLANLMRDEYLDE